MAEKATVVDVLTEEAMVVDVFVDTGAEVDGPVALQTNWMLLSCHLTPVLENPDHTKAVTAFAFAPEKELSGTVTVCMEADKPLTV